MKERPTDAWTAKYTVVASQPIIELRQIDEPLTGALFSPCQGILLNFEEVQGREPLEYPLPLLYYVWRISLEHHSTVTSYRPP